MVNMSGNELNPNEKSHSDDLDENDVAHEDRLEIDPAHIEMSL